MNIREATEADIPRIVSLLKLSLGEKLMPKTEEYWRWKHIDNPFGSSLVLIAEVNDMVIGVRAFMRWRWRAGASSMECVRAVDTATHPEFQGKGVFSKLTKAALSLCRERGYEMVFNTPNKKSLPGYIKLGWEKAGNLPLTVKIIDPFAIASAVFKGKIQFSELADASVPELLSQTGLASLLENSKSHYSMKYVTDHTVTSLKWRYHLVPVVNYQAAWVKNSADVCFGFFYRIKSSTFGKEMRITDLFYNNEDVDALKSLVKIKVDIHRPDYLTIAGMDEMNPLKSVFALTGSFGPVVTIRKIQSINLDKYRSFKNWYPSLGDLELF